MLAAILLIASLTVVTVNGCVKVKCHDCGTTSTTSTACTTGENGDSKSDCTFCVKHVYQGTSATHRTCWDSTGESYFTNQLSSCSIPTTFSVDGCQEIACDSDTWTYCICWGDLCNSAPPTAAASLLFLITVAVSLWG